MDRSFLRFGSLQDSSKACSRNLEYLGSLALIAGMKLEHVVHILGDHIAEGNRLFAGLEPTGNLQTRRKPEAELFLVKIGTLS